MDGVNCLTATEPLRGDSLLLTTNPHEILVFTWSTLERWKDKLSLEPPCGFETGTTGHEIQRPNQAPFLQT